MLDRYVFSVIYKDCDSDDDTRKFYSAVNWLFTPDEADALFAGDFRLNFSKYILHSQSILADNNYRFPENPHIHSQETEFNKNLETALASGVFYSDLFAAQNYRKLQMQTFIGLDRDEGLFESLFWLLDFRPPKMRKYLSFCIGALSAAETYGVALVLMYNDILAPIVSSGNFNGAMAVNKLFYINGAFKIGSQIPSKAKMFANLDDTLRKQAISLFETSEDSTSYWNVIDAIATNDKSCFNGAGLVRLLGTEGFKANYKSNKFSTRQMVLMFKERDQIFDMPDVIEILRNHPGVVEAAEKELAEEQEKQTDLKTERKPAKKDKKKRHRDDKKNHKQQEISGRHSKKTESDDKHNNKAKFFSFLGEVVADCLYEIAPFVALVIILLLAVALGVCMYFVGIKIISSLPAFFARFVYGIQITILVVVSLICGCILKSKTEKYMNREKRKKRSSYKED